MEESNRVADSERLIKLEVLANQQVRPEDESLFLGGIILMTMWHFNVPKLHPFG